MPRWWKREEREPDPPKPQSDNLARLDEIADRLENVSELLAAKVDQLREAARHERSDPADA